MTTQRKIEILAAIVAVALIAVFLKGWLLEREARIKAEATQAADNKVIAASQEAIRQRDAATAQTTAALAAQSAALRTPQQAAQVIVHYLPVSTPAGGNSKAVSASIPVVKAESLPADVRADLPSAPSYGILTDTQLVDQAKLDVSCQATTTQFTTCQQDKADLQKQLTAQKDETETWKAVAKGGTKMQRFVRALKQIGCAAGGAGIGALAYRSSPAIGAAAGGAAATTACTLF